jgi:hypothetical protein
LAAIPFSEANFFSKQVGDGSHPAFVPKLAAPAQNANKKTIQLTLACARQMLEA